MDKYLYLVWEYRHIALTAVGLLGYVVFKRATIVEEFKAFVIEKMLLVEKMAKENIELTGVKKMEFVVNYAIAWVETKVPLWAKPLLQEFATKERIAILCQKIFDLAMDYLDDQQFNKSYVPTV